tara:strand:- start:9 stop:281 length:273 start_codon:yes stop_codon:yes gene_type:complete
MKIFIYKTLIVITSIYFLFQFTVGQKIRNYEAQIESLLNDKQNREKIVSKIKKEIRSANNKENIFTPEEKELLSNFINKLQKELSLDDTK